MLEPIRIYPPKVKRDSDTTAAGQTGEEEASATAPAETESKPAGEIPSLALTFRVTTTADGPINASVDLGYAIYLEDIATLDEQRTYIGGDDDASTIPTAGGITGSKAGGSGADSNDGRAISRKDDADLAPSDQTSVPDVDNATALSPAADVNITAGTSPKGRGRNRRKTRLLGAWRRADITPDPVAVQIPTDGTVVTLTRELTGQLQAVIATHYAGAGAMRPFTGKRNELDREALTDQSTFAAAIAHALDNTWTPTHPDLELTAFAQPLGGADYLISIALRNMTEVRERTLQDLSVYDCQLAVHVTGAAALVPQRFALAPDDYRMTDLADVIGYGTSCVAVAADANGIRSETLPTHVQNVIDPRDDHVAAPRWATLADNPSAILASVQVAMEDYQRDYQRFVNASAGQPHHDAAARGLDQFSDEIRRFALGRSAMRDDPRLAAAFQMANEVFSRANAGKSFDTWRLFQLVYIVSHLPALAAREHAEADLRRELDYVDVLWFPAGGGKTEAYLGLIIAAMFYDRLRGKNAGVTSWLRFPLRMLSVQQLVRTLRLLVLAEDLRVEKHIGSADADPFALGYLVGAPGTPNALKWERGWWKGWDAEARRAAKGTFIDDHAPDRLVTQCPYCSKESVVLDLDVTRVRLIHRCIACSRVLPLHMSDEEVYRYLPAIVISTVDKLTGYTWFGEYTAFSHGPRYRCPAHGYFSFPVQGTCPVGPDLCPPPKGGHHLLAPVVKDPTPALTVQDEMHLLKEELGAFSAHYEGLIAELQRGGPSRLPTKILAASATIEQYEDQLRQVYGRMPRAFPSPGYDRTQSFYIQATPDVRRTFVGILPHYRRKADVAAIVQSELLRAVTEAEDNPDAFAILGFDSTLWSTPPTQAEVNRLLFDYEVSLGYVNSKTHGAKLDEELRLLSDRLDYEGFGPVERVVLTGQVPIPDLADAINRVQTDSITMDRARRLRALVGTSVVSHGVDLDRLNVLIMAGMPTTAADYIQVTARAGRTHAGLVVSVYDSFSRRERSLYSNFASYHQFLDQMVTPVPVNKYAYFVAARTLPGIALALLHDLARDESLNPPAAGVRRSKDFQAWWRTNRTKIDGALRERLRRCYATPIAHVNDPGMEAELANRALKRWDDTEAKAIDRPAQEPNTAALFDKSPLSNFRDIDTPAEFQVGYSSREAFAAVTGAVRDTSDQTTDGLG